MDSSIRAAFELRFEKGMPRNDADDSKGPRDARHFLRDILGKAARTARYGGSTDHT